MDKRIPRLIKDLEKQGWKITETRKGWMVYPPDASKDGVAIHKTPSDGRWYQNCISRLKRSGYLVR